MSFQFDFVFNHSLCNKVKQSYVNHRTVEGKLGNWSHLSDDEKREMNEIRINGITSAKNIFKTYLIWIKENPVELPEWFSRGRIEKLFEQSDFDWTDKEKFYRFYESFCAEFNQFAIWDLNLTKLRMEIIFSYFLSIT